MDKFIFANCKAEYLFLRFANFLYEQLPSVVPEIFNNPLIFRAVSKENLSHKIPSSNWHIHCRFVSRDESD